MKNILIFVAGAAVGSVVTYKLVEKRFQQLADEEIESVINTFKNRPDRIIDEKKYDDEIEVVNKDAAIHLNSAIKLEGVEADKISYNNGYKSIYDEEKGDNSTVKEEKEWEEPYVIAPEYFQSDESYKGVTWKYYADKILADEDECLVHDPEKYLGDGTFEDFIESEDDAVYVRNENEMTEYEVLKVNYTYDEAHMDSSKED